ncbi:orexin receptor type 2-like isoform X2 [Dermatophagoides pteronyssinus]|uniref:orexin receptor type 2-like isoform X2 n=1 Tax=Dermatophagoides pteronyssinus TaxID=6956 RepID=UPI003F67EE08
MSTYQLSSLFFSNNDNDETTTESISASTTTATFLWLTNDIVNPSTLNPLLLSSSSSSSFKFNQTFQQQQLQNYQHHHQNRYQNNQNYNLLECQEQFFDIENFTDLNFPGERFETKAFGLDEYFKITIYIIAIIASIFGNSAVVLSVLMKRSLRVTVNLYLANLAVADILICICCMWVHLINHLTAPTYVLGPFFCKINSFAQMTCLTSSVLSLSAIACDRYMAIMYPLRTRVTKQRTGIVITCIWIVSLIISIPFYYSRRYETVKWVDYTQTTCMEDWPYTMTYSENDGVCYKKHTMKTFYYTLVTTTLFFVPVLIMITAYSAIILILWGNRLPGEANESNLRHQKKSKRKLKIKVILEKNKRKSNQFSYILCLLSRIYSIHQKSVTTYFATFKPKILKQNKTKKRTEILFINNILSKTMTKNFKMFDVDFPIKNNNYNYNYIIRFFIQNYKTNLIIEQC